MLYQPIQISDFIEKDLIAINVKVKDKKELVKKVANIYKNAGAIENKEDFYNTLVKKGFSGMWNRVAVADFHYGSIREDRLGIIVLKRGIKFRSRDLGKETWLVSLRGLIAPGQWLIK